MRNIRLVIKHEILTTLSKRSYWLTTILLPLAMLAFTLLPQFIAKRAVEENSLETLLAPQQVEAIGYVDQAGIIDRLPPSLPAGLLAAFPDEASAQAALAAGQVDRYYVITADFLESGDLIMVDRILSVIAGESRARLMEFVINYNLVGDENLAMLLLDPTPQVASQPLAAQGSTGPGADSLLGYMVPFAVMFILFFTITMSAGYMLQSVAAEKENRTAEVLLLSLRPVELMMGKVLGLGAVALLQIGIWLGVGLLLLNRGPSLVAATGSVTLPAGFVVWAVLYFVLGYLLYSSALGALGALAPGVREGSQFTFFFLLPLMVPLWLNTAFIQSPNGTLATVLSLFPLTAPTSMVTRLASGTVPGWQPLVGLAILAATTYLFVLLAARFFRADTLLSQASLDWRRIVTVMRSGGHTARP